MWIWTTFCISFLIQELTDIYFANYLDVVRYCRTSINMRNDFFPFLSVQSKVKRNIRIYPWDPFFIFCKRILLLALECLTYPFIRWTDRHLSTQFFFLLCEIQAHFVTQISVVKVGVEFTYNTTKAKLSLCKSLHICGLWLKKRHFAKLRI